MMPAPRLSLLDSSDLDLIHERTLEVLERVGVVFRSAAATKVLAEAGCLVDSEAGLVRFPSALVDVIVRRPLPPVLLAGRDPSHDALLDGATTYSATGGICPHIVDLDSGLCRQPSVDDLKQAVRLADALDPLGIVWYSLSPTMGVEPGLVDLTALACMLANTGKHIMGQIVRPEELPFALEMLHCCGGERSLAERPIFSAIYCPVAPLQHEAQPVEAAMGMAAEHIPIDIYSLALSGATAPLTLAGTVIQTNCEVLSAVVLLRLIAPDCPLIYSASAGIMDMRSLRSAYATPEVLLMDTAMTELAHWYGLPALSVGNDVEAARLGFRAGVEDMALALQGRLSRPDLLVGLGMMESGRSLSLQKMVLDAEIVEQLDRFMAGIALDEDSLALPAISEVGPGGHYLGLKQTRRALRSGEHWLPRVLARTPADTTGDGEIGELDLARQRALSLLAEHHPKPLPDGAREKLTVILDEARRDPAL
jgi:trimethylamine--corrinoid protein Co-methyltransferase